MGLNTKEEEVERFLLLKVHGFSNGFHGVERISLEESHVLCSFPEFSCVILSMKFSVLL